MEKKSKTTTVVIEMPASLILLTYICLAIAQVVLITLRIILPAWEDLSWGIIMLPTIIGFGVPVAILIILFLILTIATIFSRDERYDN